MTAVWDAIGGPADADALIGLVKARKGPAHAPKQIAFVTELPMTGIGKVDKRVLRASFWEGCARIVGSVGHLVPQARSYRLRAVDPLARAMSPT